ncbi:MAG: hypothetical protein ACP5JH_02380 [Bacteroidota bacterium]
MRNLFALAVIVLLVGMVQSAVAQDSCRFIAFVVRGDVQYLKQGQPVQQMKPLQFILPNSEIVLGENAYVKVGEKGGTFIELHNKARVSYEELKSIFEQKPAVPQRTLRTLLEYMWKRLITGISLVSEKGKEALVPGAVRGAGAEIIGTILLTPRNGAVIGDTITLLWYDGQYDGARTLVLRDKDFDTVFRTEVTGSSFTKSVRELHLEPGETYFWSVTRNEGGFRDVAFKLADRRLAQQVNWAIGEIERLTGSQGAVRRVAKALMYEKYLCFGNAYFEYASAARDDPNGIADALFASFLTDKLGLAPLEAAAVIASVHKN